MNGRGTHRNENGTRHANAVLLTTALASALALCLLACDQEFEPGSKITSPRILALQADRPYARPGEQVELSLLAANPDGAALQWAWATCTLPESSTIQSCIDGLDAELERFDPEEGPLRVTVPEGALTAVPAEQKASALIGVVVVACPGELRSGETAGVPARCVDANGRERSIDDIEFGIKRIFLREHDRNANPTIERVTWDGKTWDEDEVPRARLCTKDTVSFDDCSESLQRRIGLTVGELESGRDEAGGSFRELLIVQFYATHGLFRDEVRIAEQADNRWVAQGPIGEDGGLARLWFVARDDRGGVSWTTRQVELVP
jgi:hypothetical protein